MAYIGDQMFAGGFHGLPKAVRVKDVPNDSGLSAGSLQEGAHGCGCTEIIMGFTQQFYTVAFCNADGLPVAFYITGEDLPVCLALRNLSLIHI